MTAVRRITVVEIVVAVEILAVLVYLALPVARNMTMGQRATRIASEIRQVQEAARLASAQSGQWPEDGATGSTPASLASFLPPSFSFQHGDYALDWDRWALSDGSDPAAPTGDLVAVSVVSRDQRLVGRVVEMLGAQETHFTLGNRATFVVSKPLVPASQAAAPPAVPGSTIDLSGSTLDP